jgi:murein DD-endopeptidase MepM/ murein hydrolase activator NlpD
LRDGWYAWCCIVAFGAVLTALLGVGVIGLTERKVLEPGATADAVAEARLPKVLDSDADAPASAAPLPYANVYGAEQAAFEPDAAIVKTVSVRRGGTLMRALIGTGADRGEAAEAIASLRAIYDPRRLNPGQEISVTLADPDNAEQGARLIGVTIDAGAERSVAAIRGEDGRFAAIEIEKELRGVYRRITGEITDNLFTSARRADLPVPVIMALIRLYSWDVDFQRDIQRGDTFEVFYERLHDVDGAPVKEGEVAFTSLTLSGKEINLYRFEDHHSEADYYHQDGGSVRKALLRTPVDGARLSSGYGRRKHPVLGYTKMHQGVDFAAPKGTPIMAGGDGVVESSGRNGAYGKYVRIRHNAEYKTAYGHMSRIAKAAGRGKRVRQGDIIGYVGSTGRSTGPHLHYEILLGGRQINPMTLKLPTGAKLAGDDLERFRAEIAALQARLAATPVAERLVAAD